jgi:hypothetical protein
MSQYRPNVVEVTARTEDQMYQGTALALTADKLATAVGAGKGIRALSAIEATPMNQIYISPEVNTSSEYVRASGATPVAGLRFFPLIYKCVVL